MCLALPAMTLAASVGSTVLSTYSAYQQAGTAKTIAQRNATAAERNAQDAIARGEEDANKILREGAAVKSSQRVNMAAKGLDLGYGTAADLQDQVDFFSQADAATARTNARRSADNYRAQSSQFQLEAAAQRPWLAAGSTFLGGASTVADRWLKYKG